jgi:hypothetical protein
MNKSSCVKFLSNQNSISRIAAALLQSTHEADLPGASLPVSGSTPASKDQLIEEFYD